MLGFDSSWLEGDAAIVEDVEATIRYWRNSGCTAAWIATQLRCRADWPTIRMTMLAIERGEALPAWARYRL